MRKFGIAVSSLAMSHQSYRLLRNINSLMDQRYDTDIILFYENMAPYTIPPKCAVMQINELFGYDGVAIATSLSTADKLARFPGPKKKLFYCWDLDWLRLPQKQFETLRTIYANPELTLVARAKDHRRVIEDAWNIRVADVVDEFDLEQLFAIAER